MKCEEGVIKTAFVLFPFPYIFSGSVFLLSSLGSPVDSLEIHLEGWGSYHP